MKIRRLLFLPLILNCLLAGCSGDGSSNQTTSYPDYSQTDYPLINLKDEDRIISGGSYGGYFIEVNNERYLADNTTYQFIYQSSYYADPNFTVTVAPEALATVETVDMTKFNLITNEHTGDFLLKIENALGELVYRNVVHVRKAVPQDDVARMMVATDKFKSVKEIEVFTGSWRLSFTTESPLTGALNGGDELEQGVKISFTLTYVETDSYFDCYVYNVKTLETNASQTNLTEIMIARCLDYVYVYDSNGILTMLRP